MRVLEREETMSFADAMRKDGSFTRTENGAVALNTTGDARLDLFGTIGSLREADEGRIETLFAEAYNQDALFATKIAFYQGIFVEVLEKERLSEHHPLHGGETPGSTQTEP